MDWRRLYQHVDRLDAEAFAAAFSEDGRMTFGNAPALVGRSAVETGTAGFFKSIKGLRHEFVATWEHGDTSILEFRATYHRLDGKTVTIPAVTVFRLKGGKIQDGRVFYDPSPIYA